MTTLSRKERMLRQLRGQDVDRVPMVGGWMLGAQNLATVAGVTLETYLADPLAAVLLANENLGSDALVPPIYSKTVDQMRSGALEEKHFDEVEPEALLQRAAQVADSEGEVLRRHFDPAKVEADYRACFTQWQKDTAQFPVIPTLWQSVANFSLYFTFGYQAFLAACALYPEAVARIYWEDAVLTRARNQIIVRLIAELDLLPMVFFGDDICFNDGPMASPEFLRRHYFPHLARSIEPLVEAGLALICHCDGDVRPILHDEIAAGFSGFQGFQYETGVDLFAVRQLRTRWGQAPLLMTGLSVSRTLPYGNAADLEAEVDYFLDATDGGRGMFLFTSNVSGVEVPPENLIAPYHYLRGCDPRRARPSSGRARPWPWALSHAGAAPR